MRKILLPATVLATLAAVPAAQAVTFNFTPAADTSAQAIAGFQQAGAIWSSLLADPITVNIDIGFSPLGTGVLASAGSQKIAPYFSDVRTALTGDIKTTNDAVAVANLPVGDVRFVNNRTAAFLSFVTNTETTGARSLDNNLTANNLFMGVNRANAKALGLLPANDAGSDASITFSSQFSFDFDRSNGISSTQTDFVGVAVHEIGHALGFVSGVDTVDAFSEPNGPNAPTEADGFALVSVLDLYRYSADAQSRGTEVLDMAYGGTPFFSIDSLTNDGLFSTGDYNGDGQQASHWKDNLGLGVMDPTAGRGELLSITARDLRAFDVIGFDVVPEPSSLALVGLAGLALVRRTRR